MLERCLYGFRAVLRGVSWRKRDALRLVLIRRQVVSGRLAAWNMVSDKQTDVADNRHHNNITKYR